MSAAPSPPSTLDPLIHEPARLATMAALHECTVASFNFLLAATALSRGNFSTHMRKLVEAGYVDETKEILDRKPHTEYRLTKRGRQAYQEYRAAWRALTSGSNK